jgi:hypothetical protein
MSLQFTKIALSLQVEVPEASLERHLAASPSVVGAELAHQVLDYERQHHLSYFPAIDYFINNGGLEQELLEALQNITWVVTNMVRNELRIKLRPVFSALKFESIQTTAYTMPSIRPNDANVLDKLIRHYSATSVKVNIIATLIQKTLDTAAAEKAASSLCYRWLRPHFNHIEVTSSTALA